MNIGFTGTRQGMTDQQKDAVGDLVFHLWSEGKLNAVGHGGCHGADLEFHNIVTKLPKRRPVIKVWPGDRDQESRFLNGGLYCDTLMPVLLYRERNRKIVDECGLLIATPAEYAEKQRGGTWYTIRYARNGLFPVTIVYPDGRLRAEV